MKNTYTHCALQRFSSSLHFGRYPRHVARKLLSHVYAIIVTLNTAIRCIVLGLLRVRTSSCNIIKNSGERSSANARDEKLRYFILSPRPPMFNSRDYVKYVYIIAEQLLPFALLSSVCPYERIHILVISLTKANVYMHDVMS